MPENTFNIMGLTDQQVIDSRNKFGTNKVEYKKKSAFLEAVINIAKEPMVILLLLAASIYFIIGDPGDGIFMIVAIVLVSAISLYQDSRSRDALEKLKSYTQPYCKVIRNGLILEIPSEELVVGDSMISEEGTLISADGHIVHSNDFSVNESLLTGESLPVYKDKSEGNNQIYQGTSVTGGLAISKITTIGIHTKLGMIGKSLESIEEEETPLEIQIKGFIKKMVIAGIIVFIIVWVINFNNSGNLSDSLLKALTLAMSILPEEIPVAFTTFMALGSWRLMKMGIIVKYMKTVETLGSATVICTDKTGTITENRMSLAKLFVLSSQKISGIENTPDTQEKELINAAMWASEPIPFDPMEVELHSAYTKINPVDKRPDYKMLHEYPLGGQPPMMTHIFESVSGKRIVAAKGAPEAIMNVCNLSNTEKLMIKDALDTLASDAYRILAVCDSVFQGNNFPDTQQELGFRFIGLVAFYDPPKENIHSVLEDFYDAGITVKIITGDNPTTSTAIARQIGLKGYENCMTGDELINIPEEELIEKVKNTNLFTRMFPDAKLKIINALKADNEIVAMTGDGVNDGPALKSSHIGIAMGKKGTEIAKRAASLILTNDDLAQMVDAVAMGRRIYVNLKKAIQYIISIHIPIILTVLLPLALGWIYPNIFSPVHIIFLELIMGPTCSIMYENESIEKNLMRQKPRIFMKTFFNWRELTTSIIQGLMITAGILAIYQYAVIFGFSEAGTRTMVFTTLVTANVFLTLVNRSFRYSILTTLKYKNNLVQLILGITIFITALLLYVDPLTRFFEFESIEPVQLLISVGIGFLSVIWYELVKWTTRSN